MSMLSLPQLSLTGRPDPPAFDPADRFKELRTHLELSFALVEEALLNLQKRPILVRYAEVLPWESGPRVDLTLPARTDRLDLALFGSGTVVFHVLSRARIRLPNSSCRTKKRVLLHCGTPSRATRM